MSLSRREFVGLVGAAAAAPALLRAQAKPASRLPIAFSTLGCPDWSWRTILDTAAREGYSAIEIRGLQGEMDLPKRPEFSSALDTTRGDLKALGLTVACLGASAQMHHKVPADRTKHLDEGKRFIDLASALGAPYVRVFGDKLPPEEERAATVARIADGLQQLAAHAKGSKVEVLLESHGDLTDSPTLVSVLKAAGPGVALLWDAHHTFVAGKEPPAQSYAQLAPYIRHTHLKDSVPNGDARRYVLTGTGAVPVRDTVKVLRSAGYKGLYCFEWEKKWHPTIEDPEVAIPHYARTIREYLAAS